MGTTMNTIGYDSIFGFITPDSLPELFTLNPAISRRLQDITGNSGNVVHIPMPSSFMDYDLTGNMKTYIAVLNHSRLINCGLGYIGTSSNNPKYFQKTYSQSNAVEVLNGQFDGSWYQPLAGSTIVTGSDPVESENFYVNLLGDVTVGAVSVGIQYTMPHSPDLKLSMEIEMDGINTTNTSGGGTISNVKYTGNPLWVNGDNRTNPFDVYGNDGLDVTQTGARRNGRKSWNLKFSYMSETDLFSSNPKGGNYTEHPADSTYNNGDLSSGAQHSENTLAFNIETDDSFYAQVWNKTLGGALPFIFQPNSNDNDDFYICRFDQNSLRVSQSAYKVYDISVKIVETW
tara:strand:+ start:36 stop:1067 length:1032 start_codon:yes stop_codon:yes gene_type:complete